MGHFPAAANQRGSAPVLDLSLLHLGPPTIHGWTRPCGVCTRLCTLLCTRLCTRHSPNPLASRSSLQPPPFSPPPTPSSLVSTSCRPPSSTAPAKLLDVLSARHVPWLCPLLPCVGAHARHDIYRPRLPPPLSLLTRPDQGKGPKIACIGAFLAPIPSRQISPNSVHITDKCFVVGTLAFSLESVPWPRMEWPANYPSMCISPIPHYRGRRTEFCPSRSHCKTCCGD